MKSGHVQILLLFTMGVKTSQISDEEPDLVHELGHKFWDWMESIPWLEPRQHLYASELDRDLGVDMAGEVTLRDGSKSLLLVEAKSTIKPSEVDKIVARLRERPRDERFRESLRLAGFQSRDAKPCFLLASKWLSPRTIDRISAEEEIGWFDLAGNAHIEFPGAYLHVEGIPNPFKAKERTITWASRHAQRVLRELLKHENIRRSWRQRDLSTECFPNVSLGTVNKVVKRLVDSAYAEETSQGLRLSDPVGLLRDWAKHYKPIHQSVRSYYTPLHGEGLHDQLRDLFKAHRLAPPDTGAAIALAGSSAAVWFAPYVRDTTIYCYATPAGERAMREALDLQPAEKGANVVLWITPRSGAFRHWVPFKNGMITTSLVQTYLDLYVSGERGREAAGHLLAREIQPLWDKWKSGDQ